MEKIYQMYFNPFFPYLTHISYIVRMVRINHPEYLLMKFNTKTITIILTVLLLTACAQNDTENPSGQLTEFRATVDTFCTSIAEADSKINSVDTTSEDYLTALIDELNSLNTLFSDFAAVDFPEEYDYLEHLADEAADYMSEAVAEYTKAYTDSGLTPDEMQAEYDNASDSYNSAFKRIKVIITFLNGESSEDATVSTDSGTLTDPGNSDQ